MEAREARTEFEKGRLTVDQLLNLLEEQQRTIRRLQVDLERMRSRLAQYEPDVRQETSPAERSSGKVTEYSLQAEEKRRRRRKRKNRSPGRRRTCLKFADAERFQPVYPEEGRRADCLLVRERAVWRLEDGRAVLVGYRIFRAPGGDEPSIPGVTPRCEYGIEILVVLAFLVYVIGVSLDKACRILHFFCQLPLGKSQADALLRQLARHWDGEFDALCDLLAHAAIVSMDETGWKIGKEGCSLWTFASQLQRVFVFGCHKDGATLDKFLPPDVFQGVGISDDAAVYRHRFVRAQKCWAHLLRKAIRLALLYPRKKSYQRFLDGLLELFYDAKRVAADGRLSEAGRQQRVTQLEDRLSKLCQIYIEKTPLERKPHEQDFFNLLNELVERMLDEELFTFVLVPGVEPTNNLTERLQRNPAQDRKVGRTSKTAAGAHRRSVIVSVLESLRANLEEFTLASVLTEIRRWMEDGISLFRKQWQAMTEATSPIPTPDTG
jgi:transposase